MRLPAPVGPSCPRAALLLLCSVMQPWLSPPPSPKLPYMGLAASCSRLLQSGVSRELLTDVPPWGSCPCDRKALLQYLQGAEEHGPLFVCCLGAGSASSANQTAYMYC